MAEYKIRELEVLTGIKAHTIRIWEKRYGILKPERTETQIRTYSDSELTLLLNVALLNKSGVKISNIAKMSELEITNRVMEIENAPTSCMSIDKLVLSLVEMDEKLFHKTLNHLVKDHGLESTFNDYLIPFLQRIGVMWRVGSINPAQEHFMSVLIRQKLISEIDRMDIPERTDRSILLFLPEHEQHEISLLFYQYFLRSMGVHTIYLGQGVPYDSLLESVERTKPTAILTSWLTSVDEKFMINFFKNLNKDLKGIKVYAGGAQILTHYDELSGLIEAIKDHKDLKEHFTI
jgi:MerR family transcriptional regulator, light-induced transcriptional regulator